MQKIFLFISIAVFLSIFTGCAEEKSSFSVIPPVDTISDKFQGLAGTYNITYFGSELTNINDAGNRELFDIYNDYYITNNCQKALELFPDIINKNGKNKCNGPTQINLLTKKAVIYIINNQIYLKAKMQAESGITDKYKTYKYQYITFAPADDLNSYEIKEYYYDVLSDNISNTACKYLDNNYIIKKLDEKTVRVDMFYNKKRN